MRVAIEISTGKLINAQSGDDVPLDALLQNAIAAGYDPENVDVRVVTWDEYQLLLSPPPTLAEARAAKYAEITAAADACLAPYAAEYGLYERQTWDQQASEAQALMADASAPAPLVRAMASARGMDALELAGRILAYAAAWKVLAGGVIGQRQALWGRVNEAVTTEAVQAVVVTFSLAGPADHARL